MSDSNKADPSVVYDAIVIGTGISGGWAAKELCEQGLNTLVLERGPMVEHIKDYPMATKDRWDLDYRGRNTPQDAARQLKQARTGYVTSPFWKHWFVDDIKHPYSETRRFDWIRGYQVGGRSLTWGRQSYRWGDVDFEANKSDGHGVDWPIRYADLAPWYDKVEEYIGVSGETLGLAQLPDGKFCPPMDLNCVEQELKNTLAAEFDDRLLTIGRVANITGENDRPGRTPCQYRNKCMAGCPYGGYFSSNSSTLPAAERTGNMTLRVNSVAHEIVYDESKGIASGVRVIDAETREHLLFQAQVIFCCASTMPTTSILMQSTSARFPNGMGNDSGELGHNIMDHHFRIGAVGTYDGHQDKYYRGRRPNGIYIPRFRNLNEKTRQKNFVRGYGYQGGASRTNWTRSIPEMSYGEKLKESLIKPGPWRMGLTGFGEMLPHHDNRMTLDHENLDEWGLPIIDFDVGYQDNERAMRKDMQQQAIEMLTAAGFSDVRGYDQGSYPGLGIHEMGTARMGRNPKTSVLNANNQLHAVANVYVTDGSCMTSAACQNPSLTYMALTARAAHHAATRLNRLKVATVRIGDPAKEQPHG
jgi:choline dehydrogenase-like flavoprotein